MKGLRFFVMSLFLHFSILFSFGQKEANIWYFGLHAGLDFNSGSPVALTDGQTYNVFSGTACMSDSNGNLLFYSDGVTVWNRNHQVMQNGTGLLGSQDPYNDFSGQYVMAIPKPGSPNIYYIFVSYVNLSYSEIDMSLDNGLGAVTNTKNVILTLANSTISAVHHANGQDIWVLTHGGWDGTSFDGNFYAILVNASGVRETPVVSFSGHLFSHLWGVLKFTTDGTKLVTLNDGNSVALFDFNSSTGVVSNRKIIDLNDDFAFTGAEFSPSGNVLYISGIYSVTINEIGQYTFRPELAQFDLTATNIGSSKVVLDNVAVQQLQLGPDRKIYGASGNLSVINLPEILGAGCNYVRNGVNLNGGLATSALPQFIQSFFYVDIYAENVCYGDITQFHLNGNDSIDSVLWDFGDPTTGVKNTSTVFEPTHVFSSPGTYTVTVTATKGSANTTETATVTIYEQPTATQPPGMYDCDEDGDGYVYFDLTLQDDAILNGQDPAIFEVLYYTAPFDSTPPITDPTNFRNIFAYEGELMYARVKNRLNPQCEAITTFGIGPISVPNQNVSNLTLCDNTSVGTDFDGLVQIDLTQKEDEIFNGQNAQDFKVSYFTDAMHQNAIADPTQYQNTNLTETIYVLVSNNFNSYCSGETQFDVEVYLLPVVSPAVELKQCDDDLDGFSAFNLIEVLAEISSNYMQETITFHESEADANAGNQAIENTTTYISQVVSSDVIYARIENNNGCFTTSKVNLVVTTTQIPSAFMLNFYACDVGENGISTFDFLSAQAEIEALFPLGQDLVISYYRNQADALEEIDPIEDISDYTNVGSPYQEQIYVRVDSKIDNDCIGLGAHINLYVAPLPEFEVETPQIVCSSDPTFTVLLDPEEFNLAENYSYSWFLNGAEVSTSPTLTVSTPGTYSVTLTKTDGTGCSRTKEIFVNASEIATITSQDITVVQLSDNNSITINTNQLGLGDYEFALDFETSIYQDEPYFDHVSYGRHILFVRDKKGCGTAQLDVFIMGFPKYFTPNDDGFNDTWNIEGLGNDYSQNSKVYIFDRYGKLLKELNPRGQGWNGTFGGEKLRSSDYWFLAELVNNDGTTNTYRGHFSLVR